MKKIKVHLVVKILIAIALGILCSNFFPIWLTSFFKTINGLFSNFLGFMIPLIIIGLVVPGIADLGKGAGRLLLITAGIAYLSTVTAGLFSYFGCDLVLPSLLEKSSSLSSLGEFDSKVSVFFSINIPPILDVMSALVFAFILGIGLSVMEGNTTKKIVHEFKEIILMVIDKIIIPFLPIYIFGIFLIMGVDGHVSSVLGLFVKIIILIFVIHVLFLIIQFSIVGTLVKKNPFKMLWTMMPAYLTALGTQSSAATIPVTLVQAKKNGADDEVADFVVPLCATIHLAGSTLKIVACAFAISYMVGMPTDFSLFIGFIFMLGIVMVAAPGVPGGAIMAALGVIGTILGYDANLQALMIALYIAMDSFGTACNVTGDGAIAVLISKIKK